MGQGGEASLILYKEREIKFKTQFESFRGRSKVMVTVKDIGVTLSQWSYCRN